MLIVNALAYDGVPELVSVDNNTGPELVPGVTVE
jgi:hypothetical protein